MNQLSIRVLGCSASLILGLTMLVSGCGPIDVNDPDYLMQMKNSGADLGKKDDAADEQADMQAPPTQAQAPQGQRPMMGAPEQAGAAPVAPVAAVAAVPVIETAPPIAVVAPPIVENMPPVVINTAELRNFRREVHHFREIIRNLPSITQHTVNNIENVHHRYFTKITNVPTHATQVCPTFSSFQTAEVMPTVEVTLPVAETIIPCVGIGVGCVGGFGFGRGPLGIY